MARDDEGNFIISLRGSSTVYYIDRVSKAILWRLGGKKSDFKMGEGYDAALFFLPAAMETLKFPVTTGPTFGSSTTSGSTRCRRTRTRSS